MLSFQFAFSYNCIHVQLLNQSLRTLKEYVILITLTLIRYTCTYKQVASGKLSHFWTVQAPTKQAMLGQPEI